MSLSKNVASLLFVLRNDSGSAFRLKELNYFFLQYFMAFLSCFVGPSVLRRKGPNVFVGAKAMLK